MAKGLRAPVLLLAGLALTAPATLGSTAGEMLLEAEGRLLVGTGGVPIGDPDPLLPGEDDRSPPVSEAVHPFEVPDCDRWLLVQVHADTEAVETPLGPVDPPAPAVVDVGIHAPNGSRVAGEFGSGNFSFATTEAQPPGGYELRVHHWIGTPVVYNVTVEASNDC